MPKGKGSSMSEGEAAAGAYERWDLVEGMESEKREQRKARKGVPSLLTLSPERAITLLYVLLALTFVLFMALTIVTLQRVSAMWEALEQARMRSENSHTTARHNLSEAQDTLDEQLSVELKVMRGRLQNVSQEVERVWWKVAECQRECGKELADRLRVLEERDVLEPVLQQLAEARQEQSRVAALLDKALQETHNLSEIFCTRCPSGWQQFDRTCYFFSSTTKPWLAAKEFCTNFSAHLAIVDSQQENKFLANHVMENQKFWLGLTDRYREGDWQWTDGRSLSLPFWNNGEPNNVGSHGEDCATIYSNGRWNDVPCFQAEPWICERSC
ncbi:C-type lectin domain family 17, member A-like isoform X2 [Colius striatus]|uniref:C-type lectin domain family 17, member A-like isoform X2 n=1 Tax=Colius striatus TaxID=57412 RepID=UPI002B1D8B57|nr:C-type lectin domain family 17, member A-like isoform X2 [Colius striatus]